MLNSKISHLRHFYIKVWQENFITKFKANPNRKIVTSFKNLAKIAICSCLCLQLYFVNTLCNSYLSTLDHTSDSDFSAWIKPEMKTSPPPHTSAWKRYTPGTESRKPRAPLLLALPPRSSTHGATMAVAGAARTAEIWPLAAGRFHVVSWNAQEGLKLGIRQSTVAYRSTSLAPPISCEEYGSFRSAYDNTEA